jgi:hypothetical protein
VSVRVRLLLLLASGIILLPAAVVLALRMPTFGDHTLPYGDAINQDAPVQRHVSNMVSAVNFDYRGFDTLGEEFMMVWRRDTMALSATTPPGSLSASPLPPAAPPSRQRFRLQPHRPGPQGGKSLGDGRGQSPKPRSGPSKAAALRSINSRGTIDPPPGW